MVKTRCFYHRWLGDYLKCDICVRDTENGESELKIVRSCDGCEHYIEREEAKKVVDEYLENLSRNERSN